MMDRARFGGFGQGYGGSRSHGSNVNFGALNLNPAMMAAAQAALQSSWGMMGMLAGQQGQSASSGSAAQTSGGRDQGQNFGTPGSNFNAAGAAGIGWGAANNAASNGGFSSGFSSSMETKSSWGM